DGLLVSTDGVTSRSGIGDTRIGAKLRLWATPGGAPVLSVLPAISLPTADSEKGLGSGDTDVTVAVLTGADLSRRWHADVNYGIGSIGAGNGDPHFVQHLVSTSVSVAASDNWNPYVEGFWLSKEQPGSGPTTGVDAGAIYELGSRMALDGGLQVTRTGGRSQI